MKNNIIIKNATTNNLKNITMDIPKNQIIAVTGVSGSGKSSFVFDTIASRSQTLLNETYSAYIQNLLPKYKKPSVDEISNLPVSIVINQKRIEGNSRSTVGTITDAYTDLRLLYSRLAKPFIGYSMKYSFNNTEGMCKTCEGLGKIKKIEINKLIDFNKSLNEDAIDFPTFKNNGWRLTRYTESGYFDNNKKIKDYVKEGLDLLLYSNEMKPKFPTDKWHKTATYIGLIPRMMSAFVNADNKTYEKELEKIVVMNTCPSCQGQRLNEEVLSAKINGKSIADCAKMPIEELLLFIKNIKEPQIITILNSLTQKLESLLTVGLGYLSLDRETSTLSGGESQRIKMTKHLNNSLSDILYIFDEPSVGLHPEDIRGINKILLGIKEKGNSIILVDHDLDIIKIADKIINFGEGAGSKGGNITYYGTYEGLLKSNTLTAKVLNRKEFINSKTIDFKEYYGLDNVSKNNLKDVSVKIPKGAMTVVSGVAGSGKSTLIRYLFKEKYPESIVLDQKLPAASSRSNLATYLGVFDEIKKVFSNTNNVSIKLFSPTGEGACPLCKGKGYMKLDLAYLGDTFEVCEQCKGKRFNDKTLCYSYKGKSISDILDLTSDELLKIFNDNDKISLVLNSLIEANLNYVKLGQTLDTLSGGELQRLKTAKMLSEKSSNIIILDEPSTGLHEFDIVKLLKLFKRLVKEGNTLIVLEHNLTIISKADWIIDLGPKGGNLGGKILFQGYPVDFLKCENSYTSRHLNEFIKIK